MKKAGDKNGKSSSSGSSGSGGNKTTTNNDALFHTDENLHATHSDATNVFIVLDGYGDSVNNPDHVDDPEVIGVYSSAAKANAAIAKKVEEEGSIYSSGQIKKETQRVAKAIREGKELVKIA